MNLVQDYEMISTFGLGANMQFYPENTKLTVVDPNPFFKQTLMQNIEKVRYILT